MTQAVELKVNPDIYKILSVAGGQSIVILQGYVGVVDEKHVRLYEELNLSHYHEIPRSAIIHVLETSHTGRSRIVVPASTQIVDVEIISKVISADTPRQPKAIRMGIGLGEKFLICTRLSDIVHQLGSLIDHVDSSDLPQEKKDEIERDLRDVEKDLQILSTELGCMSHMA